MEEGQKEEIKENEETETPKEETLPKETPSTEAPSETPQIEQETPAEKASQESPKEEIPQESPAKETPLETQPEVEKPQVETQEIPQEAPPAAPVTQPPPQPEPSRLRQLWQKFLESLKERKTKRLEKILQLVREKGEITNDDVEKLLRVSDKTATRYLNELVREGKLKRLGPPSHAKYQIL